MSGGHERETKAAPTPRRGRNAAAAAMLLLSAIAAVSCSGRTPGASRHLEAPPLTLEFADPSPIAGDSQAAPAPADFEEVEGTVALGDTKAPAALAFAAWPPAPGRGSHIAVELKHKQRFFGMRHFVLRMSGPGDRSDVLSVYEHLRREGILAPRVDWARVRLNGVDWGVMAVEELVAKELLESQQRREGVTFGFEAEELPVAYLDVDGEKKVRNSPELAADRATAEGLLQGFLRGDLPVREVFDIDLLARFLSIAESWRALELVRPENLHFYFNPVSQLLEPIGSIGERGYAPDLAGPSLLDRPWPAQLLRDPELRAVVVRESRRIADSFGDESARNPVNLESREDSEAGALLPAPGIAALDRNPIPSVSLEEALQRHPFLEWSDEQRMLRAMPGTWTVTGSLILPAGLGLAIEAGTTLRFGASSFLLATGPLRFRGSAAMPIVLEGLLTDGAEHGWQGIVVLRSDEPHLFEHVVVRDTTGVSQAGWSVTAGVTIRASQIRIEHGLFQGNRTEDAINLIRSRFQFRDVSILDASSDAFDCDHGDGSITGGVIRGIGGDGIDVSGTNLRVEGVVLEDIRDKALSVGERSHLEARDVLIRRVGTAVASKDGSDAVFEDSQIFDVEHVAIMAYTKKKEYGPGRVTARNIAVTRVGRLAIAQSGNFVSIDGVEQVSEEIDVEALYERGYMKK